MKTILFLLPVALLAAPAQAQPAAGPYYVAQTFQVGGEGGWDYLTVDPQHKLLFVPRTTHTMVLDAVTGKTVADIPGQKRNHGVALAPDVGRGFISDGEDGSVVIFDLKTYKVLGKVKAAADADGIIYDPASRKVLVSCGDAGVLVPISPTVDPEHGKADPAIPLGGKPEFLAADGRGVLVNLVDKDQVAVVYTDTWTVDSRRMPTAPGGAPVAMAFDGRAMLIGCRKPQKLVVMYSCGLITSVLPIGAGVDATVYDGDGSHGYAFASCRDGTLSIARHNVEGGDLDKFEIIQTLKTAPGAKTMGLDPTTHTIYLPTAEFSEKKDARGRPIPKPGTFKILVVRRTRLIDV